jgi:hypothetical protein
MVTRTETAPAAEPSRPRWIETHLGSSRVSRVIYGAIIGLALVLALQHHPPEASAVAGALAATAVAVGLAELYSELVGAGTRGPSGIDRALVAHTVQDVLAVAVAIAFPAVYFLMASADWIELDTAFRLAKWTGLGLIGFYGFCGARVSGRSWLGSAASACVVVAIGALLIALKALVH